MSGHWEEAAPVRVTRWERAATLHDFSGFPRELYEIQYPAPGAPELSDRIAKLLEGAGIAAVTDGSRPLDHGVWVPLRFLYPDADVPVVEISQPISPSPLQTLAIGRALARLRDEGALLIGTGGLVHNLHRVRFPVRDAPAEAWAAAFERWVLDRLRARDLEGLASYRRDAPEASLAAPTPEHFDPLFFAAGATDERDRLESVYEGFEYGNLSMRTVSFVPLAAQSEDTPGPPANHDRLP